MMNLGIVTGHTYVPLVNVPCMVVGKINDKNGINDFILRSLLLSCLIHVSNEHQAAVWNAFIKWVSLLMSLLLTVLMATAS